MIHTIIRTKYLSIYRYDQDINVNIAKGLYFPKLRGKELPSIDLQGGISWRNVRGFAINWLGIRVRISTDFYWWGKNNITCRLLTKKEIEDMYDNDTLGLKRYF